MKKHACLLALVFVAVLFLCLLNACESDETSSLNTYTFGRDKIPSITSVIGERTIIGEESEGKNEFPSKQYTYQSNSVSDDLFQYVRLLQEKGWTITGDGYNLEESQGNTQFVKESANNGQILVLFIAYTESEYTIKVTKLEAALDHLSFNGE